MYKRGTVVLARYEQGVQMRATIRKNIHSEAQIKQYIPILDIQERYLKEVVKQPVYLAEFINGTMSILLHEHISTVSYHEKKI